MRPAIRVLLCVPFLIIGDGCTATGQDGPGSGSGDNNAIDTMTDLRCAGGTTGLTISEAGNLQNVGNTLFASGIVLHVGAAIVALDASAPPALMPLDTVGLKSLPGMVVAGTTAYIADGDQLLTYAFDGSKFKQLGTLAMANNLVFDVAVSGTRAYVPDASRGINTIDVSDPATPHVIGHVDAPMFTFHLALRGNRIFAESEFGTAVYIFDLGSPDAPRLVGTATHQTLAPHDVDATGNTLYFADSYEVSILDITNPGSPTVLATFPSSQQLQVRNIAVAGKKLYVSTVDDFEIFDVSTAASPRLLRKYAYAHDTLGGPFQVIGDRAFVSDNDGIEVLDVAHCTSTM